MIDQGRGKVIFADMLRGVAMLCVVAHHYAVGFWADRNAAAFFGNFAPLTVDIVATPSAFAWLRPAVIDLGQFGVGLFFVISGFVIPFSFRNYGATGFLVARVLRIYPTYVAGFTVGLLSLLLSAWIYAVPLKATAAEIAFQYALGLGGLVGSRPIDGVVWTLEIELKFYLLCALVSPWLRGLSLVVFVAPMASAAVGAAAGSGGMSFLTFMWCGVALHYHFRGAITGAAAAAAVVGLFAMFMASWAASARDSALLIGPSYGAGLLMFCACYWLRNDAPDNWATRLLSDVSYPAYVSHTIFGFLLLRLLAGLIGPFLALFAALLLLLTISFVIHIAVERPTHKLGIRLGRSLSRRMILTP
jgi:peptidoglycan/LPS O-acetylase OafA/YrhL